MVDPEWDKAHAPGTNAALRSSVIILITLKTAVSADCPAPLLTLFESMLWRRHGRP